MQSATAYQTLGVLLNPVSLFLYSINVNIKQLLRVLTQTLIFRKSTLALILLRGGLGNQLYQISALSYFCRKFDAIPIIYDFDISVGRNKQDYSDYRNFNLHTWFPKNNLQILDGLTETFIRYFLGINRRLNILPILREVDLLEKPFSLSRFMLIQDSFQNCRYPLSLPENFQHAFLSKESTHRVSYKSRVAVHIRLTDFLHSNPFDVDYYSKSIDKLDVEEIHGIFCFSDDINLAKSLLKKSQITNVTWPEAKDPLSASEFLSEFSRYPIIIASKSSLCWWASFLAWKNNPNLLLIHPWAEEEDFIFTVKEQGQNFES